MIKRCPYVLFSGNIVLAPLQEKKAAKKSNNSEPMDTPKKTRSRPKSGRVLLRRSRRAKKENPTKAVADRKGQNALEFGKENEATSPQT